MRTGSPKSGALRSAIPSAAGIADVHRPAVHQRKASRDLDGAIDVFRRERSHRHDQGPLERACADTATVRDVHRNVDTLQLMGQRQPGGGERPFKGERASEQESHQIVAPVLGHVGRLVDERAVLGARGSAEGRYEDRRRREGNRMRRPGVGDLEKRARLRVAYAEAQEIESIVRGQNDQVGLGESRRKAAGRSGRARRSGCGRGRERRQTLLRPRQPARARAWGLDSRLRRVTNFKRLTTRRHAARDSPEPSGHSG